jgi:hypothetical protein
MIASSIAPIFHDLHHFDTNSAGLAYLAIAYVVSFRKGYAPPVD